MAKSKYIEAKKTEINNAIEFAIEEHLTVLNSDIILPEKKVNGVPRINDVRLLPTVKSREIVYENLIALLDNPDISQAIKTKSEKKTIAGLKKTMDELLSKIIRRPMRVELQEIAETEEDEDDDKLPNSPFEMIAETSDDIISSISNAVNAAIKIVLSIKDKIAILEDPETHKKDKIDNEIIPSIAERYARN